MPDYTAMKEYEIVDACRDSSAKWAEAYCQHAEKFGYPPADRDMLNTWFANAMMSALDFNEWQPIETAPKDGTEFLAIHNFGEGDGTYWVLYWADGRMECVSSGDNIDFCTHWRPLPAAPKR